jgi:hypothetical protein
MSATLVIIPAILVVCVFAPALHGITVRQGQGGDGLVHIEESFAGNSPYGIARNQSRLDRRRSEWVSGFEFFSWCTVFDLVDEETHYHQKQCTYEEFQGSTSCKLYFSQAAYPGSA